jgi:hypothetical protein
VLREALDFEAKDNQVGPRREKMEYVEGELVVTPEEPGAGSGCRQCRSLSARLSPTA